MDIEKITLEQLECFKKAHWLKFEMNNTKRVITLFGHECKTEIITFSKIGSFNTNFTAHLYLKTPEIRTIIKYLKVSAELVFYFICNNTFDTVINNNNGMLFDTLMLCQKTKLIESPHNYDDYDIDYFCLGHFNAGTVKNNE